MYSPATWCIRRTNIYLDEAQTAALDRLARDEGVSRAELIRRLVDVLITHLRGRDAAHQWLRAARERHGKLALSVVSVAEVAGGMRSTEHREVWRLLASFRLEPVTEIVARRAAELMRHYRRAHTGIELGDYLIAATAEVTGLQLATLNVRRFPMFADLQPPF